MGTRKLLVKLAFCVCLSSAGFCGTYGGGTGSPSDPFIISMPEHLQELSATSGDWGQCFKLTANVSASLYTQVTLFTGVFDGDGHSITGFSYLSDGGDYGGFFGRVEGAGAAVKDLTIIAPNINVPTKQYVGAIVGRLKDGTVSGCTVLGGSIRARTYTGGVVGYNWGGSITGCASSASVTGNIRTGGIAGASDHYSYITGCVAESNVTSADELCGGVVGENLGEVTACCSYGDVIGIIYAGGVAGANGQGSTSGSIARSLSWSYVAASSYVGGLVGRNVNGQIWDSYALGTVVPTNAPAGGLIGKNESAGTVARCYSTGYLTKTGSNIGGLVGQNAAGGSAITASFWDTQASGQAGSAGGEGKTTYYMQQVVTYTAAGWDFLGESANGTADKWRLCQDGMYYPGLNWEWSKADLVCPNGVEFVDFAVLAASWAQTAAGLKADLDGSGTVDIADIAIFVQDWLTGFDEGLPT